MKKVLSLILVMLMVFSGTVSANSLESIAMMDNYEAEINVSVTLEKPLDFLKELPGIDEVYNYVELDDLIESLIGTTVDMNIQSNFSEDLSDIQAKVLIKSRTPVVFNKNVKLEGEFLTGMWIDANLADEENPKFDIIIQTPFYNKYLTIDVIDYLEDDEETLNGIISILKMASNKEFLSLITSSTVQIIEKHATVTKGNNTINITFDQNGANNFATDLLKSFSKYVLFQRFDEESTGAAIDEAEGVTFFGKDGIKEQYTFDRSGNLTSYYSAVDFDFDLYPLICLDFGDIEGLDKEECRLSFKVIENAKYSKVGKTVVDFPEITEENSINVNDWYNYDYGYEYEYEDYPPYYISISDDAVYCDENDVIYGGIRGFLDQIDFYHNYDESTKHYEYTYENEVLTVKNTGCTYLAFSELVMTRGENKVLLDGVEIELENPVIEANDRIYIGLDFFEKVFGYEATNASHELFEDSYYVYFSLIEEF